MSIPLWSLFIAALMLVLTKAPVAVAQSRSGGYDNAHPRAQQAELNGWGARALASHQNMIEAFPVFAAGVLVVLTTGTLGVAANVLCIIFVLSRIGYTALYLLNLATLRSLVWGAGFVSSLGLMLLPLLR
ncbi:MAG: MAPEG family protein [Pseudomonadota bacterium]|nr:MAPEG family protein [Pseudomonadota bacterium]